jgi:hypothetical protein
MTGDGLRWNAGRHRQGYATDGTPAKRNRLRRLLARIRAVHDRLENSLLGDALGVVLLFGLLFLALWAGGRS